MALLVEKIFSTSTKNIADIFWKRDLHRAARVLRTHLHDSSKISDVHAAGNFDQTFSATAVAELCEALNFRIAGLSTKNHALSAWFFCLYFSFILC